MAKFQIKNRWTGGVIFETDAETIGGAVAAAIQAKADLGEADLRGANLCYADLRDANLGEADLRGADLRGADLRGEDLRGADLRGANLCYANLRDADLRDADLRGANLCYADLRDANLGEADLRGEDLRGADLRGANLCYANLRYANLREADLRDANLCYADLRGANLCDAQGWEHLLPIRTIVPEGELIGWKKLSDGTICKLKIPAEAKRVGGLIGRKCRAEYAIVIEGSGVSSWDGVTKYAPGETVRPDSFDPDPRIECSHGIHFFITREEAEAYLT